MERVASVVSLPLVLLAAALQQPMDKEALVVLHRLEQRLLGELETPATILQSGYLSPVVSLLRDPSHCPLEQEPEGVRVSFFLQKAQVVRGTLS